MPFFGIRSLGATILEFILETSVWDIQSLMEEFEIEDASLAIQKVRKCTFTSQIDLTRAEIKLLMVSNYN